MKLEIDRAHVNKIREQFELISKQFISDLESEDAPTVMLAFCRVSMILAVLWSADSVMHNCAVTGVTGMHLLAHDEKYKDNEMLLGWKNSICDSMKDADEKKGR